MGLQNTLKALSDPIRREILELLKQRRMAAAGYRISVISPAVQVLKLIHIRIPCREGLRVVRHHFPGSK